MQYISKVNQSVPVTGPVVAQSVDRGIALPFLDLGTRRGEWLAARPGRTLPKERPGTHYKEG